MSGERASATLFIFRCFVINVIETIICGTRGRNRVVKTHGRWRSYIKVLPDSSTAVNRSSLILQEALARVPFLKGRASNSKHVWLRTFPPVSLLFRCSNGGARDPRDLVFTGRAGPYPLRLLLSGRCRRHALRRARAGARRHSSLHSPERLHDALSRITASNKTAKRILSKHLCHRRRPD